MKLLRVSLTVAILACSASAICLPSTTSLVSAANAATAEADKADAVALIKKAVMTSKGTPEFKRALAAKDGKAISSVLVKNGAPEDTTVTVNPGQPAGLTIECCSKKSWGPVIIKL